MTFVSGYRGLDDICRALGLDGSLVHRLQLVIAADEVVHVRVEQYVTRDQLRELAPVLRRYHLVDAEPPPPPAGAPRHILEEVELERLGRCLRCYACGEAWQLLPGEDPAHAAHLVDPRCSISS